jgi:hypothetical protein
MVAHVLNSVGLCLFIVPYLALVVWCDHNAGLNLGGVLGPLVDQVGQILTGTVNGTLGTAANITGWTGANTTAPTNPCTWTGITCNALGNITGLYMPTTHPHRPSATLSLSHTPTSSSSFLGCWCDVAVSWTGSR